MDKIVCRDCNWQGQLGDQLSAANPFEPDEMLYACPKCKSMELTQACEHEGCWKEATNGGPGPDGKYRRACSEHGFWKYKKEEQNA